MPLNGVAYCTGVARNARQVGAYSKLSRVVRRHFDVQFRASTGSFPWPKTTGLRTHQHLLPRPTLGQIA